MTFWPRDPFEPAGDAWHDTAQICLNGHVINREVKKSPEFNQKFCVRCGAEATTQCPKCKADIRGEYHGVDVFVITPANAPAPPFCIGCGAAYPWTQARLDAARELTMTLDALTPPEREMLAKSLDDLVRDTPRTTVAATLFKKAVAKAGGEAAGGFKDILISVVTEAAKKMLWP
jgi:hypothetical protein